MTKYLKLLPGLVFTLVFVISCQDSDSLKSRQDRAVKKLNTSAQMLKPTVVMISIDGFRPDYLETFKPPTLLSWAKDGVRSEGLVPSFPTLTFPNHVTLVTGLRPGNHGIVGNKFYDERRKEFYNMSGGTEADATWYRGEPLWTVAEKQGMLSATAFWVGSEARIGGVDPTYLKPYDGKVPNSERVTWVTEWLSLPEERRPHYINIYFSDVDSMGHKYGPTAEETKKSVLAIDAELGRLKEFIQTQKLDVQIIVVSDHGMKSIENTVDLTPVVKSSLKDFKSSGRGATVSFYTDDDFLIDQAYEDIKKIPGKFSVYRAHELPARWQLNDADRRGDIVVVGEPGTYIGFQEGFSQSGNVGSSNKATHGWDVQNTRELDGLFIAHGSAFKRGLRIPAVDNIHIYPLVMEILKLRSHVPIDGKLSELKPILKN